MGVCSCAWQGVFVEGLSEWVVRSPQEIYGLMERGGAMRATGSTKMNEMSSRSHAVFIIIAEQVPLSRPSLCLSRSPSASSRASHRVISSPHVGLRSTADCMID